MLRDDFPLERRPRQSQYTLENSVPAPAKTAHHHRSWIPRLRPSVASIIASLCSMSIGAMLAYPSPAVPDMNAHPNPIHLDKEQASWFSSLLFLGGVPGALASGWIMDFAGRKMGMMSCALPTVISWLMVMAGRNLAVFYVARLITGYCFAASLPMVGVYISEIAPPRVRGLLMSIHELALNMGVLLVYVVGAFVSWRWLAVLCSAISCLLCVLMTLVPESPRWLLMRGRREEAEQALEWLRHGVDPEDTDEPSVQAQLEEIELGVREATTTGQTPWLDYFRQPLLPSLALTQAMFVLQELSGINVLRSYTVSIFQAAGTDIDPNLATIVVGIVLMFGSLIFTFIVELMERRTFGVLASLMMAVSLLAMGAFFKLKECGLEEVALKYLYWLPLLCMIVAAIGYVFGVGPLPYVLTSEVFPTRARARASSMGVATLCLAGFLITKLFTNMTTAFGASGAFWFCGCICVAGAIMCWILIPKTKGRSLEEMHTAQATK